jgi:hypothetical protein
VQNIRGTPATSGRSPKLSKSRAEGKSESKKLELLWQPGLMFVLIAQLPEAGAQYLSPATGKRQGMVK